MQRAPIPEDAVAVARPGLFLPGTRIATARGARRVEALRPDDRVLTRDHGFQPVLELSWRACDPYRILQPEDGPALLPRQRLLLRGTLILQLFGTTEVLAEAGHLGHPPATEGRLPDQALRLHLPRAELIWADGRIMETAIAAKAAPARRCLDWHEAAQWRAARDQGTGIGTGSPLGTVSGMPSRPALATGSVNASRKATSASISAGARSSGARVAAAPIAAVSAGSSRIRQSAASISGSTACARS